MSDRSMNGVVVDGYRLLVVDEPGESSGGRALASAALAAVSSLLGDGEDLEGRSYRLRVSVDATASVVAERLFRSRRSAEAARKGAIARHQECQTEGRPTDWQKLLDAAS